MEKDVPIQSGMSKSMADMDRDWEVLLENYHQLKFTCTSKLRKRRQKQDGLGKRHTLSEICKGDDKSYEPMSLFKKELTKAENKDDIKPSVEHVPQYDEDLYYAYDEPYPRHRFPPRLPYRGPPPYHRGPFPRFGPSPWNSPMRYPRHFDDLEELHNRRSYLPSEVYRRLSPGKDTDENEHIYRDRSEDWKKRQSKDRYPSEDRDLDRDHSRDRAYLGRDRSRDADYLRRDRSEDRDYLSRDRNRDGYYLNRDRSVDRDYLNRGRNRDYLSRERSRDREGKLETDRSREISSSRHINSDRSR